MCAEDEKIIYIDVRGVPRFNRRTGVSGAVNILTPELLPAKCAEVLAAEGL